MKEVKFFSTYDDRDVNELITEGWKLVDTAIDSDTDPVMGSALVVLLERDTEDE